MCLILFALQQHPEYPLIVAANRDEFFERPSQAAGYWQDQPEIYAGRDLQAGGTWLGVNRLGQFAALTNFREPGSIKQAIDKASRGELPQRFLAETNTHIDEYFARLQSVRSNFNGYNLICGTPQQFGYCSNRGDSQSHLQAGVYGLSNGLINTPWPKVATGKQALTKIIHQGERQAEALASSLFSLLGCSDQAPDHQLPDTGVGLEWERTLSPRFIKGDIYGTRTSTVVLFERSGSILFYERNFNPSADIISQSCERLNPG